jgi:hypothetical protein
MSAFDPERTLRWLAARRRVPLGGSKCVPSNVRLPPVHVLLHLEAYRKRADQQGFFGKNQGSEVRSAWRKAAVKGSRRGP